MPLKTPSGRVGARTLMKITISIRADYLTEEYEGSAELEVTRLPGKAALGDFLEEKGRELLLMCDK